jgi:hypothetical protein
MEFPADAIARHQASIEIAAAPEVVYDLVADVTRMGEWSPEAVGADWIDGGTGRAGDWFTGHNRTPDREWSRECEVARAERGRDFTFVVGGVAANCTWWSYEMEPIEAGTRLTERWWMVNKTPAMAAATPEQFATRVAYTETMLIETIAGLKRAAESV